MDLKSTRRNGAGTSRRRLLQGATALAAGISSFGILKYARAADEPMKLKFLSTTSPPDPVAHPYYYAREKGFFKEQKLDVAISEIISATNATRVTVTGESDLTMTDPISALQARQASAPIRITGSFSPVCDYFIVGRKDIQNPAQLQGRRFSVATIGGSTQIFSRLTIEAARGDPSKVQWAATGSSAARAQALIANTFDATIVQGSFVSKIVSYPDFHIIADVSKVLPNMLSIVEISNEHAIQTKHAEISAFVRAVSKAVLWAYDNPKEAAAVSVALLPNSPKEEITAAIDAYTKRKFWSARDRITRVAYDYTMTKLFEGGQLNRPIRYEDMVTDDFML
jgi:NitT/TauT family transport system substrate-binding protein